MSKWHSLYIDGKNYDRLETESAIAIIEGTDEEFYWEIWNSDGYLIEAGLNIDLEFTKETIEEVIAQNIEISSNY